MYNDRAPQMFIMMSIIEKIVLIPSEDNWLVNDGAFQLSCISFFFFHSV